MDKIVLFWILLGVAGFAFALTVQMRVMIALVLRRALADWSPAFADRVRANAAVVRAADAAPLSDHISSEVDAAAAHLRATYPNPLRHLQTARRYSLITPILLIALLAAGRFVLEAF